MNTPHSKGGNFSTPRVGRKRSRLPWVRHGSLIIELSLAMALLTGIGLVVFKASLDLMAPRQWVIYQNVTDAYMTYEEAYAERISFEELTAADSPWPVFPAQITTQVEMGKFPGGTAIMGTVIRTRVADSNNLPASGGSGTNSTNPSGMQTWQVQSHVTYSIGDDEYVKSRTVIRSQ